MQFPNKLEINEKNVLYSQTGFRSFLMALIALLALVSLPLNYADSCDPVKLFVTENKQYSCAGYPLSGK